ncbi:sensor histidine kinase [Symbioplanes lichenis]|uniref:sensor histidine kinase n=1 Tax=Symbioplanes lichenis TaxID=1629072 RepID=UPI00273976A9|nr:sensor histidine kinase [Actinoplanes lichenis]
MTPADQWKPPPPTARQQRIDVVIGLAVAAAAVLNGYVSRSVGIMGSLDVPSVPEQIAWGLAISLPLCVRRRYPDVVAIAVATLFIGAQLRYVQEQSAASVALVTAIYTLGVWGRDHRRSRIIRIVIVVAMFAYLAISWIISWRDVADHTPEHGSGELSPLIANLISSMLVNAAFFGFGYLFGEAVWQSRYRQHVVEQQSAALVEAQREAGERALLDERLRIARELHDVVAHHVSVMGIQASAARRVLRKDADLASTALTSVEEGARTAVGELRKMLGALRASQEEEKRASREERETATAAGVERVADLAESVRAAGLHVSYGVYGDEAPVPASVSQAAYRIVQEAVTNTLKHAHASTLDIRVRYLAGELEVDVADDGRGPGPDAAGGAGMGLTGMRERVAVHDGTLETGRRTGGGFRVRARLPLDQAAVTA